MKWSSLLHKINRHSKLWGPKMASASIAPDVTLIEKDRLTVPLGAQFEYHPLKV